jgi:predicted phage terminase large subunit-like protein
MNFTEEGLIASISKESFFEFLKTFWGQIIHDPLVPNWHIKYLCDELQIVAERVMAGRPKLYDLLINVPPGSSKSTICSQMLPAWVWTRMAHAQFICCSYAERIALKDALRMRDLIQSELYQRCFPGIELREDLNTKGLFKNTQKGYRLSAGLGGQVMGEHGHFLIVDDPIDPEQSFSDAELAAVNRFMETTLPSRKIDKEVSVTILIQQRLHQNDPSGIMQKRVASGEVRHICLPGEIREGTNIEVTPIELKRFYCDDLMDPVRMSRAILEKMEKALGAYGYASQILQDPVPLGGGMFETNRLVKQHHPPKRMVRMVRSWDKAGTEGGGAYTVGLKMGVDDAKNFWILDIVRGQWKSTRREEVIKETAEMDGDDVEILLEVEGGSGGKESGESTVRNLAGYKILTFHPTGDKVARAWGMASQVGSGNVNVLVRPWTSAFIEELRFFPHSTYKDQVDAASAAFNRLARKKRKVGAL